MYLWQARDRLCMPRMVWFEQNHNDPKYELKRWHKPNLRAYPLVDNSKGSRIEYHRWKHSRFAGCMSEWPNIKYGKRKRDKSSRLVTKR
jgi:hypothetical protein